MAYDEEIYEKLAGNFELLCNIIRQKSDGQQLKADLSRIEEMIQKKIPDTLKKNAPEDFYELYTDFKSEYEKFRDFILYDKLIGKNIVALGGGFSSGKSSFLNALMGKRVLLLSSLLTAAAIAAASVLFSWFIGMSSRYALVYGSLASLIILLVWLYLCGNILLLGAVIGRVLEDRMKR